MSDRVFEHTKPAKTSSRLHGHLTDKYYYQWGEYDATLIEVPTRFCECCYQPDGYIVVRKRWDVKIISFPALLFKYTDWNGNIEDLIWYAFDHFDEINEKKWMAEATA